MDERKEAASHGVQPGDFAPGSNTRPDYKVLLVALYTQYNPERLGSIDGPLERYAGQESVLIAKVCKKYGVFNEPPSSHTAGTALQTANASARLLIERLTQEHDDTAELPADVPLHDDRGSACTSRGSDDMHSVSCANASSTMSKTWG